MTLPWNRIASLHADRAASLLPVKPIRALEAAEQQILDFDWSLIGEQPSRLDAWTVEARAEYGFHLDTPMAAE